MLKIAAGLAIAALCVSQQAKAANWNQYAANDEAEFYYDSSSLEHIDSDEVRVWAKIQPRKHDLLNKKIVDHAVVFEAFYCKTRELLYIQGTFYYKDGSRNQSNYSVSRSYVTPDTTNEKLFKIVCQ